ncbi:MAG TPA: HNH endonuclease [Ktedonobacteraceae bacterium]|nr:HNH endonuclease [Ktedonobacteraceae bacterium]
MKSLKWLGVFCMLMLVLASCKSVTVNVPSSGSNGYGSNGGSSGSNSGYSGSGSSSGSVNIGHRTKTSGCQVNGAYQDKACTPGAVFPDATKDQICVSGYSSSVRNVPYSEKTQAYQEYGIYHHTAGQYEVDHLISLELGGSNDIANLWPEAASPTPGFHQKDQVENYLHDQVCSGAMSLKEAQHEIANDWLAVYNHMNGK